LVATLTDGFTRQKIHAPDEREVFARGEVVEEPEISGTTPTRRFTSSARFGSPMSSPRMRIAPLVGASKPVSILMVVDFPAPFGPRKP